MELNKEVQENNVLKHKSLHKSLGIKNDNNESEEQFKALKETLEQT